MHVTTNRSRSNAGAYASVGGGENNVVRTYVHTNVHRSKRAKLMDDAFASFFSLRHDVSPPWLAGCLPACIVSAHTWCLLACWVLHHLNRLRVCTQVCWVATQTELQVRTLRLVGGIATQQRVPVESTANEQPAGVRSCRPVHDVGFMILLFALMSISTCVCVCLCVFVCVCVCNANRTRTFSPLASGVASVALGSHAAAAHNFSAAFGFDRFES